MPNNQFLARAVLITKKVNSFCMEGGEVLETWPVKVWKLQIRINKQTYISAKEYKTGALASSAAKRFMERMNETASH